MENKIIDQIRRALLDITGRTVQTAVIAIVLIALLLWGLKRFADTTSVGTRTVGTTTSTPTSINSITDNAEWEFLTINNEELVDTLRKGLIGDSQLIRIYYGTLRLGIAMSDTTAGWLSAHGDTISLRLPQVKLLDTDFIDEAKTEAFYETGKWNAAELTQMLARARRQMLDRCLTQENIAAAEQNAREQFAGMLRAVGYNTIEINFAE